jgi:hypothetical protein
VRLGEPRPDRVDLSAEDGQLNLQASHARRVTLEGTHHADMKATHTRRDERSLALHLLAAERQHGSPTIRTRKPVSYARDNAVTIERRTETTDRQSLAQAELGNPPTDPTLSVFLYEIHEDLQMRTGQMRLPTFDPTTKTSSIAPGWANIYCNYIITYWDMGQTVSASPGSPGAAPDNPGIQVMNQVVNALINNRQLADLPGAYTRMLPPKDELNSLGNFWQSLGNKPRLSLNVSITVPVYLTDKGDTAPAVQTVETNMVRVV